MSVERTGRGPWARLFAGAVVPDEGSALAQRGRDLAQEVADLEATSGRIAATVGGCDVTIAAAPVSPRIWTAVARFARGNRPLEEGIAGRVQSVHLEHLLTVDWDAPLVPRSGSISTTCTCHDEGRCAHVAAAAFAFAAEIDREPAALLRWRGCGAAPAEPEPATLEPVRAGGADPWAGGALPAERPRRPLPAGAVLKRLGPSGIRVGGKELEGVLGRAYAAFAAAEDVR